MAFSLGNRNNFLGRQSAKLTTDSDPMCGRTVTNQLVTFRTPSRLIDLRRPTEFKSGFIPGSYSVTDASCWLAASRIGLLQGREIYLLADTPQELNLFAESIDSSDEINFMGWFGPDALEEWQRAGIEMGRVETIAAITMENRLATSQITVLQVTNDLSPGGVTWHCHPSALKFEVSELPLCLDGLPVETSICLSTPTEALGSFSSSLLWNFGFRTLSCLTSQFQMQAIG